MFSGVQRNIFEKLRNVRGNDLHDLYCTRSVLLLELFCCIAKLINFFSFATS